MKSLRSIFLRAFGWLAAEKIHMALATCIVIILAGGLYIGLKPSDKTDAPKTDTPPTTSAAIRIESEPAGVTIDGIPACVGEKTPYDCTPKEDRTVLLAPSQVDVNGKTYYFQSWVGCKNGDDQPGACVVEKSTEQQLLRVIYSEKKSQQTTQHSTAVTPQAKQAPKSSPGPCGGVNARVEEGNIICELKLEQASIPVEIRLLAPQGSPGIAVTCSDANACYLPPNDYFTSRTFPEQLWIQVSQPTTVKINIPVTRQQEQTVNGRIGIMTRTSSYWVYGPAHGTRCCGTNPPLIYDIYNGYTEVFKPY